MSTEHMTPPYHRGVAVHGRLAEWLGAGLQNRVQRFDSATDLNKILSHTVVEDFYLYPNGIYSGEGINKKTPGPKARSILLIGSPIPDREEGGSLTSTPLPKLPS